MRNLLAILAVLLTLALRVEAACSIASSPSAFTTASGDLASDADGSQAFTRYPANEDCSWDISCPAATPYLVFTRFRGVLQINGYDKLSVTVSGSELLGATATVKWISGAIVSTRNWGWNVTWRCQQTQCSSDNSTITGTPQTALTGTLISETNGRDSSQATLYNDVCVWQLRCPAGYTSLQLDVSGRLLTYSNVFQPLALRLPSDQSLLWTMPSIGVPGLVLLGSASVDVNYTESTIPTSASYAISQRPGFTLSWRCMTGRCTSPNGTGVTLGSTSSATEGFVFSDDDGSGSNTLTPGGALCAWTINCPTNQKVVIWDVNISFSDSTNSALRFSNAATSKVLLSRSTGSGWGFLSPVSSLKVEVDLTSNAPAANGVGFRWKCVPQATTCLSPNASFTTVFSDSFTLVSATPYYLGETCQFNFGCSTSLKYLIVTEQGLIGANDTFRIWNTSGTQELQVGTASRGATFDSTLAFSGTSSYFLNVTSAYANTSLAFDVTDPAFNQVVATPQWKVISLCSNTLCTSPQNGKLVSANYGTFKSDLDGEGSAMMRGDESCSWSFQCPPAMPFVAVSLTGSLLSRSAATVKRRDSGETLLTLSAATTVSGNLPTGNGQIFDLTLTTLAPSPGVTVSFVCNTGECSSVNATGSVYTDVTGTIYSDLDGQGRDGRLLPSENCLWVVRCPANYNFAVTRFATIAVVDTLRLKISDESTGLELTTLKDAVDSYYTASQNVVLEFSTIPYEGDPRFGFTLDYECVQSTCNSPNATGSLFTNTAGVIFSDADGYGTVYPYSATQLCSWTVSCPSGIFAIDSLDYGFGQGDYLLISTLTGVVLRTFSGSGEGVYGAFNVTSVVIKFVTDFWIQARGFSLRYACVSPVFASCQSPNATGTTFTMGSGRLVSDRDGAGPAYSYMDNDRCRWRIQCPVGYGKVSTKTTLNLPFANKGDILQILDPSTNEVLISLDSTAYAFQTVFDMSAIDVTFTADMVYTAAGFSLDFQCTGFATDSTICSSTTPTDSTIIALGATINSDADGAGTSVLTSRGSCSWNLRCLQSTASTLFTIVGQILSADALVLSYGAGLSQTISALSGQSVDVLLPIGVVTAQFRPSAANLTRTGFALSYICLQSTCRSANRDSGVLLAESLSLFSTNYTAGEVCAWAVKCPAQGSVLAFSVSGLLSAGDTISLGSTRTLSTSDLSPDAVTTVLVPSSTADVTFSASTANYVSRLRFWTLSFKCVNSMTPNPINAKTCSALPEGATGSSIQNASFGFVGYGPGSSIPANTACEWTINCPLGKFVFLTAQSASKVVSLSATDGFGEVDEYPGLSRTSTVLPTASASLLLTSSAVGVGPAGFDYMCITAKDPSNSQTLAPLDSGKATVIVGTPQTPEMVILPCSSGKATLVYVQGSTPNAASGVAVYGENQMQSFNGPSINIGGAAVSSVQGASLLVVYFGTTVDSTQYSVSIDYSCQEPPPPSNAPGSAFWVVLVLFLICAVAALVILFMIKRSMDEGRRYRKEAKTAQVLAEQNQWGRDAEMQSRPPMQTENEAEILRQKQAALRLPEGGTAAVAQQRPSRRAELRVADVEDSDSEAEQPAGMQQRVPTLTPSTAAKVVSGRASRSPQATDFNKPTVSPEMRDLHIGDSFGSGQPASPALSQSDNMSVPASPSHLLGRRQ